MKEISLQCEYFNKEKLINSMMLNEDKVINARDALLSKSGKGSDYTGWVEYPLLITEFELENIKSAAKKMHELGKYLVVIGIGGSYLGAKAVIDLLSGYYDNQNIIFLGNNISPEYIYSTLKFLEDVDFTVNVISKSGKTLEPAIAFRFIKELLIKKYSDKFNERIFVTSSEKNSLLTSEAVANNYQEFHIPANIGGRYSVFTAVGLLPLAFAGYDICAFVKGAINSCTECTTPSYNENNALKYASLRNILYENGKTMEILSCYEPKARFFGEWWKQLYGESEGKEGKGIFPVSLIYSTDLHSLGQYVQDGIRNMFETVIEVTNDKEDIEIKEDIQDIDKLNYLAGKKVSHIKKQIMEGVIKAHVSGDVPNLKLSIEKIDEYHVGYLLYFFMFACGISGYILGVNPFNQEGVEEYKKNMLALLKMKNND